MKSLLFLLPRTVKRGLRSRHSCRGPSDFQLLGPRHAGDPMTSWLSKFVPQVVFNIFNTPAAQALPVREPLLPHHSSPPSHHPPPPLIHHHPPSHPLLPSPPHLLHSPLPTDIPRMILNSDSSDSDTYIAPSHLPNTHPTHPSLTHSYYTQAFKDALNPLQTSGPIWPVCICSVTP
jgi:hypothetical protein